MYPINLSLNHTSHSTAHHRLAAKTLEFQENFGRPTLHALNLNRATSMSMLDAVDVARNTLRDLGVQASVQFHDVITAVITAGPLFLAIFDPDYNNSDPRASYNRTLIFTGYGDERIHTLRDTLISGISEQKVPYLTWEFLAGGTRRTQNVAIDKPKHLHQEFFPWLDCDPYDYFDRYLESESSILVLLGPPGTGKTSFIRSLIWYDTLNATFTYEDNLLQTDGMFVDFMTNDTSKLLVVEDADLLLTSREHDGNKIMSKFLNIGDGLASLGRKKIVFTANIMDVKKIDSALLRVGRCFDCLTFRALTFAESCAAAAAAKIDLPKLERSYTLAELFGGTRNYGKRQVGFGI